MFYWNYYFLYISTSLDTGFYDWTDIVSRFFMNDFFINSFYVLWTSFWYIPSFLLLILVSYLIKSTLLNHSNLALATFMALCLLISHYQNLNSTNFLNDNLGEHFNILLSNSINKFHPALFYVSLVSVLVSKSSNYNYGPTYYNTQFNIKELLSLTNKLTTLIIFTLFLGSWWALQEGSWGGWWNWDPSEVLGLLVMLLHLNYLHRRYKSSTLLMETLYVNFFWKLIFLTYIFIQFNFDLVSHNFGTRVDQFIDSSHNFLIVIFLIALLVLLTVHHFLKTTIARNNFLKPRRNFTAITWSLVLYAIIFVITVSSFSLLINDFMWKILGVNVLNSNTLTYYFSPLVITLVVIKLWNPVAFIFLTYAALIHTPISILLFILTLRLSIVNILHNLLILSLLSMCCEYNNTLSLWDVIPENISLVFDNSVNDFFGITLSLNNFFVEYTKPLLSNNNSIEWIWNMIWSSSSIENHSFTHTQSTNYLNQVLHSGNTISPYVIVVEDLVTSLTFFITMIIFRMILTLLTRTNVIIL